MKPVITIFLLNLCFLATGQSTINELEFKRIAEKLTQEVKGKMPGQNIALGDFVDQKDQPSTLGKYLSEVLSSALVNDISDLKVIDRTRFRMLLEEAKIGEQGLVDPSTAQRIDRMEGITAVIYGKYFEVGNYLTVFIKVVILGSQTMSLSVEDKITLTPTINVLLKGKEAGSVSAADCDCDCDTPKNSTATVAPYTTQNIRIAVRRCYRNGNNVDCELEVTSLGRTDNFSIHRSGSLSMDASRHSYPAARLWMNNKWSGMQVNQPLAADVPVPAFVQFSNVSGSVNAFSVLELNCRSYSAFSFNAQFQNIPIED